MEKCSIVLLLGVLFAIVVGCPAAWAQTFRGIIQGTVTDATGAVLAGAKVTAHNMNTGTERTTVTNSSGSFNLPELAIGTYSLKVGIGNPFLGGGGPRGIQLAAKFSF